MTYARLVLAVISIPALLLPISLHLCLSVHSSHMLTLCFKCTHVLTLSMCVHSPSRVRWMGLEKLSGYSPHAKPFEAPRPVAIACFYIAVFLFFEMAWDYCSEMLAPAFGACLYVCVYVCVRGKESSVCVCVCVCNEVSVYAYLLRTYVFTCTCVCVCVCVCVYVCVCNCDRVYRGLSGWAFKLCFPCSLLL